MPLSRYLVRLALPDDPQRTLLYSTRTAALATLDSEVVERLAQGETPPDTLRRGLEGLGLWLADPHTEEAAMLGFIEALNQARSKVQVSIILGMACNFACRYCYEGKQKEGGHYMGDEVVQQTVAFLIDWCRERQAKELVLSFYGGEPLLYPGLIRRFAALLRPVLAAHGIGFGFSLVSNGSLLTPQLVTDLLDLGLKGIKVTIDGPAATHNQLRPFKNGGPSFEVILDNLQAVCHLLRIDVGGNFTRDTWPQFPALLDQLIERGLRPERLGRINFSAAMGVTDSVAQTDFAGGVLTVNEPWHAEAVVALRQAVLDRGFKSAKTSAAICMMDLDDALVIHHDGGLYKCPSLIGHYQYQVGDIWQGPSHLRETYNLGHWQRQEKCRRCPYLPLCLGGCRYSAYQRSGDLTQVDCQEGYWQAALPGLLRQDLARRLGASGTTRL